MNTRKSVRSVAAAALLLLSSTWLTAQKPQILPPHNQEKAAPMLPPQAPQTTPQLTKEDLEAFFDGFLPIQLQRDDIAGAVVLVVKDGKVLFAKGYGYADVKSKKPVTVDATLFRPGSISKTFTWTAVMQLVEQGKLDLNRDVNDYLDFKIPATFGKPITMKDLMTHTPGFEETLKDLFVAKAADMRPLQEYVSTHLPKEIFPPGTTPAYSNYGATLAGYIVQRVSGMPFDDYIDKNILTPLGMHHTTFRQPLPDDLKPLMSQGYNKASQPAKDFEFVQAWPAGSRLHHRRRHVALHDRPPAERRVQRRTHPEARDRATDAFAPLRPGARARRDGLRLLRGVAQRSSHHRTRRRHAMVPQRHASDARRPARLLHLLQQLRQSRLLRAFGVVAGISQSLFPLHSSARASRLRMPRRMRSRSREPIGSAGARQPISLR